MSKAVETAVLKSVAAFLNSREGGTLLVVSPMTATCSRLELDDLALHTEGKDDADVFQLALTQAILNSVGAAAATDVTTQVHTVDGHDLCRVHVKPSGHPVHADVTTTLRGLRPRPAGATRLRGVQPDSQERRPGL